MLVRCRVRFRGNPMLGLDVARAIAFERGGSSTHLHWIRCSRLRLLGIGWHLRCLASPDFQRCFRRMLSQTYNKSMNEVDLGMSLRSSMGGNIGTPEAPDPVVPCMRQEQLKNMLLLWVAYACHQSTRRAEYHFCGSAEPGTSGKQLLLLSGTEELGVQYAHRNAVGRACSLRRRSQLPEAVTAAQKCTRTCMLLCPGSVSLGMLGKHPCKMSCIVARGVRNAP